MNPFLLAQNAPFLAYGLIAVFALILGSFLNVVIYRLPIMIERQFKNECAFWFEELTPSSPEEKFNLLTPLSHCPSCKHKILPLSNIPVLSFIFQKGKCRHCKEKISCRYPLVELLTMGIALFAFHHYGLNWSGFYMSALGMGLLTLTFIDFDRQLLPDEITLPLIWLGLIVNLHGRFVPLESAVLGAFFGYFSLWIIFWGFKFITGKEGMGYGDFKLFALFGAWGGYQALPFTLLFGSFLGAAVGIGAIVMKKSTREDAMPFGPYLALSGWIALLYGTSINHWYLHFIVH